MFENGKNAFLFKIIKLLNVQSFIRYMYGAAINWIYIEFWIYNTLEWNADDDLRCNSKRFWNINFKLKPDLVVDFVLCNPAMRSFGIPQTFSNEREFH